MPNKYTSFKLAVHEATGQSYEDLFIKIMGFYEPDFQAVKPHGNVGDRGNDGWCKSKGEYYQVYSPEKLEININTAINKLKCDFQKLKQHWDTISPIKTFVFVINDKFKGVPYLISKTLSDLETEYNLEQAKVMNANDLYQIFIKLKNEEINSIISCTDIHKSNGEHNGYVFKYWYDAVNPNTMTYNANYLPHETNSVRFRTAFIKSLKSFYLNSYEFLKSPSANLADTELISAIMDFRKIALDIINVCEEFENKYDIMSEITTYWVDDNIDFKSRQTKVWTLKALFHRLIMFSNRIIYINNNICIGTNLVQYIKYHEDYYPNYPILGDAEPSPAIYIGTDGEELFYEGLQNIEKFISSQVKAKYDY